MNLVTTSYAAAGIAFALLALVLLTGWRGGALGIRFLIATVLTAVWAIIVAAASREDRISFFWVFTSEIARDASWLLLLATMARGVASRSLLIGIHVLWAGLLIVGLLFPFVNVFDGAAASGALWLSRSGLALAFAAFVLIEQIYRNATASTQKQLRYFVLGVGTIFAYDLFIYAQAELLKTIHAETWAARGFVVALAAPMIALAVRRNPDWALDIFVSRQVVFYSSAFLGAGSYFFLMAVGGYYVRAMGGTWGGIAQIAFFAGAAMVLAALLFSTAMRRRLMVFISKHFFRNKYDYRVEWLRFIQTLSSRGDADIRSTSLRAIAQIFSSPSGVLYMLDDTGRAFLPVSKWRHSRAEENEKCPATEIGADHELTQFLRDRQWVIDLVELAEAPDRYQNIGLPPCLEAASKLRIVAPLLELDRLVGFVALESPPTPFELTYEDRDLLKTCGRHVATYLAQHEANRKLAESRQFEAYSRLIAFMMHDLKNAAAQLSLIVTNAERHKHNPEFIDDAIGTIGNAVDRITRLIEQLQRGTSVQAGRRTDLCSVVRRAAQRCETHVPSPQVEIPVERIYVTADPDRLGMVIEHVIRNAQDATSQTGQVSVELSCSGDRVSVIVADDGQGMSTEFIRDRLFRPFDSTKGSKGMGIGAYQAREYVGSLGGEVAVESALGAGTRFAIHLPVLSREPAVDGDLESETQTRTSLRSSRQSKQLTSDIAAPATPNTAGS